MTDRSDAARVLGSIKSPRKSAAAVIRNQQRARSPAEMGCNCGAAISETWTDHPTSCPARKPLYNRERWRRLHPSAD